MIQESSLTGGSCEGTPHILNSPVIPSKVEKECAEPNTEEKAREQALFHAACNLFGELNAMHMQSYQRKKVRKYLRRNPGRHMMGHLIVRFPYLDHWVIKEALEEETREVGLQLWDRARNEIDSIVLNVCNAIPQVFCSSILLITFLGFKNCLVNRIENG